MQDSYEMVLRQLIGCETGPCPKVFDDVAGGPNVAIQGEKASADVVAQAGHVPAHEGVVTIPRQMLLDAAAKILAGE